MRQMRKPFRPGGRSAKDHLHAKRYRDQPSEINSSLFSLPVIPVEVCTTVTVGLLVFVTKPRNNREIRCGLQSYRTWIDQNRATCRLSDMEQYKNEQ